MHRAFSVVVLFIFVFSCSAYAETDSLVGKSRDEIISQWDQPFKSLIHVDAWEKDNQTLVAVFRYDAEQRTQVITDYVIITNDRQYVAGTIRQEETLFHTYDIIKSTPAGDIISAFDSGSGGLINTIVTADGYIVRWHDDYPNIIFSMDLQVYDCIQHRDIGGRVIEYALYSLWH